MTYQAGDYVLLTNGFFVEAGVTFLAKVEECLVSVKDAFIEGFELTLSNNPTTGHLGLSFSTPTNLELEITMVDLLGRQVKTIQHMEFVTDGDHNLTADISCLLYTSPSPRD